MIRKPDIVIIVKDTPLLVFEFAIPFCTVIDLIDTDLVFVRPFSCRTFGFVKW